jgi:hypothetical protein
MADQTLSNQLVSFSNFNSLDILMGVLKLTADEKADLERNIARLMDHISESDIPSTKKSRNIHVSKEDIFIECINQIYSALVVYNSNACIDDWSMNLEIGKDFHGQSDDIIIKQHNLLISSEKNNSKLTLVMKYQRGSLYNDIKETKLGLWLEFCKAKLNVCSTTANRY